MKYSFLSKEEIIIIAFKYFRHKALNIFNNYLLFPIVYFKIVYH